MSTLRDGPVVERFATFECGDDTCIGIVASNADVASRADIGVVIVVGGPQYRVGSHRQFVTLARALAAAGVPALRFDYRGMGDSRRRVPEFRGIGGHRHRRAAIASLRPETGVARVVLWGLCDAASAALLYAAPDPRVAGIVLFNPWVRSEQIAAATKVRHYYFQRMCRGISGEAASRRHWRAPQCAGACRCGAWRAARPRRGRRPSTFHDRMHDGLARFRGPVLCVLTGDDLTAREFEAQSDQQPQRKALLTRAASKSTVRMPPTIRFPTRLRATQSRRRSNGSAPAPRALMVAYHFPPLREQRHSAHAALRAAAARVRLGADRADGDPRAIRAHERRPAGRDSARLVVTRAFALDTARQLSIGGRYPGLLARPDRWMTWRFGGRAGGPALIRRRAPAGIWSTYPIATAHVIGHALLARPACRGSPTSATRWRRTGIPPTGRTWKSFKEIEDRRRCNARRFSVFTTPGAAREYRRAIPPCRRSEFVSLENGFDEESFAGVALAGCTARSRVRAGRGHAPAQRDRVSVGARPDAVLRGSRADGRAGTLVRPASSSAVSRGRSDELLRALAQQDGIEDSFSAVPPISVSRRAAGDAARRCAAACCRPRTATSRFRRSSTNICAPADRSWR